MTRALLSLAALATMVLAACGGTVVSIPADDGGSGNTTDATVDSGPYPPGPSADAGAPDTSVPVDDGGPGSLDASACEAQRLELDVLRKKAQKCCPGCDAQQCNLVAKGVCCAISYGAMTASEAQAFTAAAKAYRAQCNPGPCTGACVAAPSNDCDPVTMLCH